MKKMAISLIGALFISSSALAFDPVGDLLKVGIEMYKTGDFTGCIQTVKKVIEEDPSDAVAHYYMALSSVKVGDNETAKKEYENVISLSTSSQLTNYAQIGVICIDKPEQCAMPSNPKNKDWATVRKDMIDNLNLTPISNKVEKELKQRKLDAIKNIVNTGGKVNKKELDEMEIDPEKKSSSLKPTDKEIAQAFKTLSKAGLNNNSYMNPEMMQMSMMMGSMNGGMQNQGANMGMNYMNMMPYLMMQQGMPGQQKMDPRMMETMINGMMMPELFSTMNGNNNNKNY